MNIAGIIIGVFVTIVGIVLAIVRKLDDDLAEARSNIETEFISAYKEFGVTFLAGEVDFERQQTCIARIKNLHCASTIDMQRLRVIRRFLSYASYLAILVIICVAASLSSGFYFQTALPATWQFLLIVGFPLLLLVFQAVLLCSTLRYEKYLKDTARRYKHLEFQE